MRLTFGKYLGKRLEEVPESYLIWVLENLTHLNPHTRMSIEQFLLKDDGAHESPTSTVEDSPVNIEAFEGLIKTWYRQMAQRHHPDRGGDNKSMSVINDGYEKLCEMLSNLRKTNNSTSAYF